MRMSRRVRLSGLWGFAGPTRGSRSLVLLVIIVGVTIGGTATGASAATFHSEIASPAMTFFNGEQVTENVFTVNGRTVKCTKAVFNSEEVAPSETLYVTPEYRGCTAFGVESTMAMNGCLYKFHNVTGTGPFTSPVAIVCPEEAHITFTVENTCTVTIAGQAGLGSLSYTNKGTGSSRYVEIGINISSIATNVSGSVLICGTNGLQTATLTGTAAEQGYSNGAHTMQVGFWVE
jgi:hypothetical protein